MPWRNWRDDDELMLDIGDALRIDPDEEVVAEAGRLIGRWHAADPDRELAELRYDSYTDGLAAVRGPATGSPRNLVFALGLVRVEIEVGDAGIEGQLIPPEPGPVWLLDATGPVAETAADEVGCFTFPARRHGPIRIQCTVAGHRVATEWITT
jgi:hypothetical protein